MGHFLGGEKNFFLIRDIDDPPWRVTCGILSIRVEGLWGRSWSVLRVQSPTPHTPPLPGDTPLKCALALCVAHDAKDFDPGPYEELKHGRMRRRRLPDPRPIPEKSRADATSEKSK